MHIFRVTFLNQGKIYQLYVKSVRQAEVYGFVELQDLIFGENRSLVIDPAEEKLKNEFSGVSRTLVPMHAIIRVDEVEKQGQCKIMDLDGSSNITPFPNHIYGPGKGPDKS